MVDKKNDPRYNQSGALDLTPYKAMKHIENDEKRHAKLMGTIFYLCDLAGYHLEGRVILRDKKTGKIWR